MRYDTPIDYGGMHGTITRAEYNARMGKADVTPPEPEIPAGGDHLWEWFWQLSGQRRSGPERLQFADISAWSQLTGKRIETFEVPVILAMDARYMQAIGPELQDARERARDPKQTKGKPADEQ